MKCIIGIDPGLQCTGYGVVRTDGRDCTLLDGGVVRTDPEGPLALRLQTIHAGIMEVMREHSPEIAVVEQLYAKYHHPHTAMLMGHARGVIYLAAAACSVEVVAYEASMVKKALTGHGRASKSQVGRMVCHLLGLKEPPEPEDVTDALALAEADAFAIVLECAPPDIAAMVTAAVAVPVISVGAGPACDGQMLVLHDLLGLSETKPAKFVKPYAALADTVRTAFRTYAAEVQSGTFPEPEHCYAPSGIPSP